MLAVLKRMSRTVIEMIYGMLVYAVVGQILLYFLCEKLLFVSLGWWTGIALAIFSGIHMWWSLDRALGLDAKDATKLITTQNMVRYAITVVVIMLLLITEVADPLIAVFGLFGLKAGAYLQPLMHKFSKAR